VSIDLKAFMGIDLMPLTSMHINSHMPLRFSYIEPTLLTFVHEDPNVFMAFVHIDIKIFIY
jgi:hypothetical protein